MCPVMCNSMIPHSLQSHYTQPFQHNPLLNYMHLNTMHQPHPTPMPPQDHVGWASLLSTGTKDFPNPTLPYGQ